MTNNNPTSLQVYKPMQSVCVCVCVCGVGVCVWVCVCMCVCVCLSLAWGAKVGVWQVKMQVRSACSHAK